MDNIDVLDWNEKIRDQEIKKDDDEGKREYTQQLIEYWENNLTNVFTRKKDILALILY